MPVKPGESSSEISHHDTDTDSEADIASEYNNSYVMYLNIIFTVLFIQGNSA